MMKKSILLIAWLWTYSSWAQQGYQWEKVDSVPGKTKDQIYSDTKMFIANTWKSAQNVIQNDDKSAGMILIKANSIQHQYFQLNDHRYVYGYTVTFLQKDGKYKVKIADVENTDATCDVYTWPVIQPVDYVDKRTGGMPPEKCNEMMSNLRAELQGIIDSYDSYIKQSSKTNSDW